jgi:hypothetical protein
MIGSVATEPAMVILATGGERGCLAPVPAAPWFG